MSSAKILLSTFIFLCTLDCSQAQVTQDTTDRVTDGYDYWEYSDEELFEYFKKKYWAEWKAERELDLEKELGRTVLLVRLFDNSKKIAGLRKAGRKGFADTLEEMDKEYNLDIVDGILDFYKLGTVYFYYPKDAHAIFAKGDFSLLLLDETTLVKTTPSINKAYVLRFNKYDNLLSRHNLSYWDIDAKKMIRMKQQSFKFKGDYYKTIEYFCKRISER